MKRRVLSLFTALLVFAGSIALSEGTIPEVHPSPQEITASAGGFTFSDSTPQVTPSPVPAPEAPPTESALPIMWLYPISLEILADALDVLRLVNKANLLDSEYPPQDVEMYKLAELTVNKASNASQQLRPVANDALTRMFADAEAEGVKLYSKSAYRSYQTQDTMHYNRVKKLGKDDGVVQAAGASDHQTGLGVDVVSSAWRDKSLTKEFAKTKEAIWLAENCARYGFVIRYPEGKEEITGIMYEAWHLRYVGVEVASYMTMMELTLEEFTAEWKAAMLDYENGLMQGGDSNEEPAEEESTPFVF